MNNVKVELYNKSFTEKIGDLTNCISCIVKEERNGSFDLDLVYPINDPLFHELKEENIIVCNANDTLKSQKFRIYNTGKLGSNKIQVYAMHISYDLVYDFVKNIDIKNQSCEYVLNTLFRSSIFSQHYKGYSDIVNAQNYKMDRANVLQAIAGKQGSIIDTFGNGAEILRDNENIHVLNKRGNDNGVVIEYGVNQTDFKLETDIVELETRIQPRAVYQDEAGEDIEVIAPFVDSPYINDYAHPYINYERDYSDKFENDEIPTVEKLTKFAQDDFKINKIDIPKYNFKIEFIPLSKCVGYESIRDKISICDIATIKDKRYNVDTKAKVIKYEFNVLRDRYESMELGEPRTKLGDVIIGDDGKDGKPGLPGKDGPIGPQGKPGEPGKDGKTKYTWIKYADDDKGNGMSNLPTNKEYIGLAYNKDTEIESNNAGDYTWSKYVGDQGIPGQPGADGKTLYTWLKYADDELGNGMTDIAAGKEYIGLAYNKTVQQESTNPKDYTWSKIKGDQGIPGKPGADGKTKYTWVKYADTPTSGMSDDPAGKSYLGLAYNKDVQQESTNYADYTWSKIKGEQGPQGKPGEEFPNTLPSTPVVTLRAGLGVIAISWTFEAKAYYTYEVYASRTKDFTPNTFDLIFKGQASNYSHYTEPKQTWYYRVRAINSHGSSTDFSEQKFATTGIIDKDSQWIGKAAIGNAQIGTLSLDRGWVDQLKGQWIDAKQLTVTDGNGKRTLDIDSFGNVDIKARNISMIVDGEEQGVVGETKFTQTMNGFEFKVDTAITPNLLFNGDFEGGKDSWISQRWNQGGDTTPVEPSWEIVKGTKDNWVPVGKYAYLINNIHASQNNVHLGILQHVKNLTSGQTYTVSGYVGGHRTKGCTIEFKYVDNAGSYAPSTARRDYLTIGYPNKNTTTYEGHYTRFELTFTVPADYTEGHLIIWNKGSATVAPSASAPMWIGDVQLEKGGVAHPFRKNVNEVQGDVTQITGKGVTIKHDLGSFSNFNAKELSQANENGDKTVSIRNGSFRVYQFPSEGNNYNAYLGGFFATKLVGRTEYGLAQGGTSSCGYISQGFAETDSETVTPSFYPWLRMVHYDGNGGDNFNKQGTFSLKPFYIAHLLNFWHDPTPDLPSRIYPSTDNGLDLNIYGNDGIDLGVRYGSTGKVGLRIDETSSSPYVTHFHWGTHNFHNYAMYNTNIVKALDAKSYQLKNKIANESSIENETYNNYSFFNNEIRYCDRQEYIITENNDGTRTLLVEIPQILAENIELDYHINISKLSWGDYRIIEKNPYYFIIETNSTNNFRFTFELVVRLIEEKQLFISKLGDEIYSMPNSPEECKDEDIKEDLNSNYTLLDEDKSDKLIAIEKLKENNELWKIYRK